MLASQRREYFRGVLEGNQVGYPISVFDPITARIADHLGARIGILGGSIASATILAAPDLIVLTLTELVDQIRRITRVSDVSLMVDADHGYGNALNVMRTVEELEGAGVAALTIEDTDLPLKFRRKDGEELISTDEMVGKLKAAVMARQDPSLVIIGRTCSLEYESEAASQDRVKALAGTGVDAIMLIGARNRHQIESVYQSISLPLLLGSTGPGLDNEEFLSSNGVRMVLRGHQPFFVAMKTLYESMAHLHSGQAPSTLDGRVASADLRKALLRDGEYSRWVEQSLC